MKKRWLLVLLTVLPAASRAAAPASSTSLERRLHVSSAVEDTTIKVGETRHARFRLADLGGAAREPIRMELRLVYTIDEFPFRGRELAAPTTVTMFEDARAWKALPRCPPR